MPVEVQQEQLDPCRIALDVQVPPEDFQQTVDRVFHQMAKRTQVPGFRAGKAPRRLLERFIDQDRVNEEALRRVVSDGYRQALEKTGLTPYGDPDLEMQEAEEGKPVSFRVTLSLPPSVEVGEYRGLTFTRMQAQVDDANVEAEIQRMRDAAGRFEDVDEPAQEGDRVLGTVQITVEGETVTDAGADTPVWLQVGANLPEFDAGLKGAVADEEKVFEFTYPEDFDNEERAGKKAEARVKPVKVQRRVVPDLDDEFAVGQGQENLEALRASVRSQMEERATSLADSELDNEILREIVARSTVHFPEEMVTREVADDINAFVKRLESRRATLRQYLDANEMDLSKLEEDYAGRARPRIANTLVLMEIARQNEISVDEGEVEGAIREQAEEAGVDPEMMQRVFEEQGNLRSLENRLFFRKVMDFLKSVNTIEEKTA